MVLESVTFAGDSVVQKAPVGIPVKVPEKGNFTAVPGNEKPLKLCTGFCPIDSAVSDLFAFSVSCPGRGLQLPDSRRNNLASCWENGFKAIIITDTTDFTIITGRATRWRP